MIIAKSSNYTIILATSSYYHATVCLLAIIFKT